MVTPKVRGRTAELHNSTYLATSLEHVIRFFGHTPKPGGRSVVTPKVHGRTVELHNSTYVATSLEHVIRVLDTLQSLVDGQCILSPDLTVSFYFYTSSSIYNVALLPAALS